MAEAEAEAEMKKEEGKRSVSEISASAKVSGVIFDANFPTNEPSRAPR